jgi:membrane-associated PAP2 superfamily phosphatase
MHCPTFTLAMWCLVFLLWDGDGEFQVVTMMVTITLSVLIHINEVLRHDGK